MVWVLPQGNFDNDDDDESVQMHQWQGQESKTKTEEMSQINKNEWAL